MVTLYYFHDPMCSWCWGYRPAAENLFAGLPDNVKRVNVLGGLAADSDQPMPPDQRREIAGHWRRIESMLGTRFNHDFWTTCEARRSTYPACRAVIAATKQGREKEMILAIQRAYYLKAQNPSDLKTLSRLAKRIGLDVEAFETDLACEETEAELQTQIRFARDSGITSFPSLALEKAGRQIPIKVDYLSPANSLNEIRSHLIDRERFG